MATKSWTILIVEDDPLIRQLYVRFLATKQFVTWEASDGKTGLHLAIEKKPDIILLDIHMPGMDGITVLQELRKDPWGASAKVIVLSNLSLGKEEVLGIKKLNADYMVKADYSLDAVRQRIESVLKA